MSKFQRPDFVSPATRVNLPKQISDDIYALTDKLTQHYVNLHLIMNAEANIMSAEAAYNFHDAILADCNRANQSIIEYHLIFGSVKANKVNEIKALKNAIDILQSYFTECFDYIKIHPTATQITDQDLQSATDNAQSAIGNQKTVTTKNNTGSTNTYKVDCQNCSNFFASNLKEIKDLSFEDLTSYYFNQDLNAICRIETEVTGDIAQAN